MKYLGEIKHEEIYNIQFPIEFKNIKRRKSVRVILFDNENRIALYKYLPREGYLNGEYGLPGGGVEEGEYIEDSVKRETLEETGCEIDSLREVGYLIEHVKKDEDTKLIQEVYCFSGKVLGEKKEPQFTERERSDLMTLEWKTVDEAISLISKQEDSFSNRRFLIFLKEIK
jgi:ADP-ribose pyrophosphatase YjhB (NUDIX family)